MGVVDLTASLASVLLLGVLALKPHRFVGIVDVALFLILIEVLAETIILGGLVPSDLVILFGLLAVIGALIVLPVRAAFLWFLAYGATLVLAVVLPEVIEPVHAGRGIGRRDRVQRSSGSTSSCSPPWRTSSANVTGSRRSPTIYCTPSCRTKSPRG